jgi:phosphoribosylanthranilate isomerase
VSGSVRIKFCGIRSADEAVAAVEAGADLIGVNFVPSSPRCVDVRVAEEICQRVDGSGVERVALFRDASWEDIEHVIRRCDFDRVQFHGEETEEEVEEVDLPVIKAIRGADLEAADTYPGTILLLDHPSEGGGQGKAWDWSEAAELIGNGHDVILAGGLDPENVGQALGDIGEMLPWGVDCATGVEGDDYRKDSQKMKAFVEAVRRAEDVGSDGGSKPGENEG